MSIMPTKGELGEFCQKAKEMLKYLNFEAKQKIIREVVEKVIGNQQELLVEGYLPVGDNNNYVAFCSINRYGSNTTQHDSASNTAKLIPFTFSVKLPAPNYVTVKRS